jgi:hypothetical protein
MKSVNCRKRTIKGVAGIPLTLSSEETTTLIICEALLIFSAQMKKKNSSRGLKIRVLKT